MLDIGSDRAQNGNLSKKKKNKTEREREIEHLYRTIDDRFVPIPARVISRLNRGSYGNRAGDTSHKRGRLTVNARYIGFLRVRGGISSPGSGPFKKQTVKARWSLIKLAPLPGRFPLIQVDPSPVHREDPRKKNSGSLSGPIKRSRACSADRYVVRTLLAS